MTTISAVNKSTFDDEEAMIRKMLATVDVKRKALELESEAITSELLAEPEPGVAPMGIDTPLVDADGYPRGDVDVFRARTLRGRLAVIRTDYKTLMRESEDLLYQLGALKNPKKHQEEKEEYVARTAPKPKPAFDPVSGKWVVMNWDGTVAGVENGDKMKFEQLGKQQPTASTNDSGPTVPRAARQLSGLTESPTGSFGNLSQQGSERDEQQQQQKPDEVELTAFARVDAVAANSPASTAGLKEEDLILKFGTVNHTNHNHLKAIAALVPGVAAMNDGVEVTVRRRHRCHHHQRAHQSSDPGSGNGEDEILKITLIPKPWDGRGLIGCHIVPYHED